MPTIVSHGIVAAGMYRLVGGRHEGALAGTVVAAALSMLPDADVVTWNHAARDGPYFHRGFSHSLAFAAVCGVVAALFLRSRVRHPGGAWMLALNLALCTATHGVLDTFTDGGSEVALLWPFTNDRYRAPIEPIPVSPITLDPSNLRLLRVLAVEALLLWPAGILMGTTRTPMPWWGRGLVFAALSASAWAWWAAAR